MNTNIPRWSVLFSSLIAAACGGDPALRDVASSHSALGSYVAPSSGLAGSYSGNVDGTDSANGHDGTLIGGATIGAGQIGSGFQFDGQAAGVQVPNHDDFNFGTGSFTIETWVRVDASVVGKEYLGLVGKLDSSGRGYTFFLGPPGHIGLQLANSASDFDNHFSPALTVRDGGWHHVAVTVDRSAGGGTSITPISGPTSLTIGATAHFSATVTGTGVQFFVDGAKTEPTPQNLGIPTNVSNGGDLFLGRHWSNLGFSLAGGLDEVALYSGTLATAGAIVWSATGGAIDGTGLWTAPSIPGTYEITATAQANPSVSAHLLVTVEDPTLVLQLSFDDAPGLYLDASPAQHAVVGGTFTEGSITGQGVQWSDASPSPAGGGYAVFDGGSHLAIEPADISFAPNEDFTIQFWFKSPGIDRGAAFGRYRRRLHAMGLGQILGSTAGTNLEADFDDPDGGMPGLWTYWQGSGSNSIRTAGGSIGLYTNDVWHHYWLVRQAGLMRLYVGDTQGNYVLIGAHVSTQALSGQPIYFGRSVYFNGSSVGAFGWFGALDEIRILRRATFP